jgi:uncharacterized phage-associated protein
MELFEELEYTTFDLAAYIVKFAFDKTEPVTNLALQKLLYFFQYASLVVMDKPLNRSIQFEAWQYGPVVRDIYYHYRIKGSCLIYPDDSFNDKYKEMKNYFGKLNDYLAKWVKFNPWRLVDISHKPGGAWYKTFHSNQNGIAVIPIELIKNCDLKKELEII